MVAESVENKLLLSRLGHYVAGVGGEAGTFELFGKVRWTTPGCEMGIEFVAPAADELLKKSA